MSKNNSNLVDNNKVEIINNNTLKDKIHIIRGVPVMLDVDLAKIYGYETKYFNRQVRNNKERFEGEEFMFQLTEYEFENLKSHFVTSNINDRSSDMSLRCKNCTSNTNDRGDDTCLRCQNVTSKTDNRGGARYLPYAFTEQGTYMLMTVLKGELAIKQSRALVMTFKAMKDYIMEANGMLEQKNQVKLLMQVTDNTKDIADMHREVKTLDQEVRKISHKMSNLVMRNEISPVMMNFAGTGRPYVYLLLNGEPAKATETYINIYAEAKHNIIIVDNYIDIKSLRHLQKVKKKVKITILSDNVGQYLSARDYQDFQKEFTGLKIKFIKTCNQIHDRFIILDYDADTERIFHCGASSKDAGYKMTAIVELKDEIAKSNLNKMFVKVLKNPKLVLR